MAATHNYSDEYLMDLLKGGSATAFEELYKRYSQKLLALMCKMLNHNEALAQDLLHDTFLKIIEKPEQFNSQKRFEPWIYTIAANACRKTYRAKLLTNVEDIKESELGVAENIVVHHKSENSNFRLALNKALDQLSYEHKETFVLKHQHELSIKQIAVVLQCAEGTVKSRLFTARKILAKKLNQYHPKSTI